MKSRGKSLIVGLFALLIFSALIRSGASRISITQLVLAFLSGSFAVFLFVKGVFTKKANKRYERKPLTAWSALDAKLDPTDEMNRVEYEE